MADKALLCGVNSYKLANPLKGCESDVAGMEQLLTDAFGFSPSNIKKLTNAKVTKQKLLSQWKWLIENAKPGDRLVFHFSGHGSYTADANKDDGWEAIHCLYDFNTDEDDPNTYLRG